MAKWCNANVYDYGLRYIADHADTETLCAGQPTDWYQVVDPAAWVAQASAAVGDVVRPTIRNGCNYRCTAGGTSGANEPTWPTTPGQTVTDGTITWECVLCRALASKAVVPTDISIASTASGRKLTVAATQQITAHQSGVGDHVVLSSATTREVLVVGTANAQQTYAGNLITITEFAVELISPT